MKRILLVGHGNWIIKKYIVEEIMKLDYSIVLLSPRKNSEIDSFFEKVIIDDGSDYVELMRKIDKENEEKNFDGIMGYDEVKIPLVEDISRHLGLPVVSYYDSKAYRYKDRMRMLWESNGLPCPHYAILNSKKEIHKLKELRLPIILKPVSYLSSIGVCKVDTEDSLLNSAKEVFDADLYFHDGKNTCSMREQYNLSNSIIAEEYIGGTEYSAEGYSVNSVYHLLGITKKYTISDRYFDETGHIFPAKLNNDVLKKIKEVLVRAHKALGIANSFTHTEFKIYDGKIYLIEIGARLSGDYIPKLVELTSGISPIECAVKCRTGENISVLPQKTSSIYGIWFINATEESYGNVFIKTDISLIEGCDYFYEFESYYKNGQQIEKPCFCGLERVGHVIFRTDNYDKIADIIEDIKYKAKVVYKKA